MNCIETTPKITGKAIRPTAAQFNERFKRCVVGACADNILNILRLPCISRIITVAREDSDLSYRVLKLMKNLNLPGAPLRLLKRWERSGLDHRTRCKRYAQDRLGPV